MENYFHIYGRLFEFYFILFLSIHTWDLAHHLPIIGP